MTFLVNNREYKGDEITLYELAINLPECKYNEDFLDDDDFSFNGNPKIKTCSQREYVIRGRNSKVRYLGTGGVGTCFGIFIQNELKESFFAHSDIGPNISANEQFNWDEIFSKFSSDAKQYKIILIGGLKPGVSFNSKDKAIALLNSLFDFAKKIPKEINLYQQACFLKLTDTRHKLSSFLVDCSSLSIALLPLNALDSEHNPNNHSPNKQIKERGFRSFDIYQPALREAYSDMDMNDIHATGEKLVYSPTFINLIKNIDQYTDSTLIEEIRKQLKSKIPATAEKAMAIWFRDNANNIISQGIDNFSASQISLSANIFVCKK